MGLRVALITKRYDSVGGLAAYVDAAARALTARGIAPTIITGPTDRTISARRPSDLDVRRLGVGADFAAGSWRVTCMARSLERTAGLESWDIVHCHDFESALALELVKAPLACAPRVFTCHLTPLGSPPRVRLAPSVTPAPEEELVVTRALVRAIEFEAYLAPSRFFGRAAASWVTPGVPVEIIPPGVDLARFRPGDRAAARAEIGYDSDRGLLALVPARVAPRKGIEWSLAAADILRRTGTAVHLVITGPVSGNSYARQLIKWAAEFGWTNHVTWADGVPEDRMPIYYRAADVVLLPSLIEGLGISAMEAAASGCPSIVTRSGGLEEVTGAGVTGAVVRFGDAQGIARELFRLARYPEYGAAIASSARRFAERVLDITSTGAALETSYRRRHAAS